MSLFEGIAAASRAISDAHNPLVITIASGLDSASWMRTTEGLLLKESDEIAAQVKAKNTGLDLSGTTILMTHIGLTSEPQAALTNSERNVVELAWRTLLEGFGAVVVVDGHIPAHACSAPSKFPVDTTTFERNDCEDLLRQEIQSDVLFATDESTLSPSAEATLAELIEPLSLDLSEPLHADVTCHTDSTGDADYNISLSERRGHSVLKSIETILGARLDATVTGLGENDPRVVEDAPEGSPELEEQRHQNRRCELTLRLATCPQ
jgi:outer membrane protein OmpA-like peptidoglycan-associated protein